MMSFMDEINQDAEKYGGAGKSDTYEFKKGENKIRILAKPRVLATHFFGKGNPSVICVGIDEGCKFHSERDDRPSIKLVTYVLDRRDEKVKLAELPLSISYALNDLQEDSEMAFDDFPMPYDVKIKHDPDNKDPKAKYRLMASTIRADLSDEEEMAFAEAMKKMTPDQYVDRRKAKQKMKGQSDDVPEYNDDDVAESV